MTPGDLLEPGACSLRCRSATTAPARCRCTGCRGQKHGESVYLDALIDARRRGLHRLTDLELLAGDCA